MLHGFMGSGKNLRTLAQRWSDADASRTFLLLDLRGHGTSPALESTTTMRDMAQDVFDTVEAEGLSFPIDLVGHSLGGRVSLSAFGLSPEKVDQLVMLDITPGPIKVSERESGHVLSILRRAPESAPDRRTLKEWFAQQGLSPHLTDWLLMNLTDGGDGKLVWRFNREALHELHGRVNQEDLWSVAASAGPRLHLMRGDRSEYVTDADLDRLRESGARVLTLKGAGHFVHVDAADALLQALTALPQTP